MDRRTAVAFVGDDASAARRVSRAVEAAWHGPDEPSCFTVAPAELGAGETACDKLAAACGVVVTATAAGSAADRLSALPADVPVIALVTDRSTATIRTLLTAGVDDVVESSAVGEDGAGAPNERASAGAVGADAGPDSDPLAARLSNAVDPYRATLGEAGIDRLSEVLLDAGTTLMSTRSDEVTAKIEWTMESVGEHADLDRIICYRRGGDRFEPAYDWCPDGFDPVSRPLEDFPAPEELSTFGDVARSSPSKRPPRDASGRDGATETDGPPATVHVPLVVDWELSGVVAFESDDSRVWRDDEVALYRTAGDLIAHTIARNDRRAALRRQADQLEQFSAVVSHDLRNPLNVLSGYLELTADELPADRYEAMSGAVDRMETLIDDLLMLARRGEAIGETEPVSVAAVAREAWRSVRAPEATLVVGDDGDRIEADPSRLRQAFENLFRNAVDHGRPDVTVEVGGLRTDGGTDEDNVPAGVYVADDGPGIPADVADSVFESGVSAADGSGIGLAIVDRIAEAHGWEVSVRNDGGAVFEFAFDGGAVVAPD